MLKEIFIFTLILISIFFLGTKVIPFSNEDSHILRAEGISQCIKDRQIPCRWILGGEFFYGSPIFNYYPPLPYYFGQFSSYQLMFLVGVLGSYIFMYLFISKFLEGFKAHILAIFYSMIVFLVMVFHSEGLGITWGLMFLPLFLSSKQILVSSMSLALLILSIDVAYIIGLILFWVAFEYFLSRSFTYLFLALATIILAILLSSFYIFPSVLERNLVHSVSLNDPKQYLPRSAQEKPKISPDSPYQILTGEAQVSDFEQGTNWLKFKADVKSHTIIRLSQYYFPNWKIFVDGKEAKVEYENNSLGLMTIILGEGQHEVVGKLYDTDIRKISNIVTIFAAAVFLILFLVQFKIVRRWLTYYRKAID